MIEEQTDSISRRISFSFCFNFFSMVNKTILVTEASSNLFDFTWFDLFVVDSLFARGRTRTNKARPFFKFKQRHLLAKNWTAVIFASSCKTAGIKYRTGRCFTFKKVDWMIDKFRPKLGVYLQRDVVNLQVIYFLKLFGCDFEDERTRRTRHLRVILIGILVD